MLTRALVSFSVLTSLSAVAVESRPFAPLPLDTVLTFRSRLVIYAGYTSQSLTGANGAACELRVPSGLPKDLVLGPQTPLTVVGGHVQRIRWAQKTATPYHTNDIGETSHIAWYSGLNKALRDIRFASAFMGYGGDPAGIARVYAIGGLALRPTTGEPLSLLCWKGAYVSGGTFPGMAALDDVRDLVDVKLGR